MCSLPLHSYKLSVLIEDRTGRVKIFLFGGVAEQVVRRTAADLVEESSSNQILLPAPLRGLVGRRYVFQLVISEQTFRTGQLCFQARRVFVDPTVAAVRGPSRGSSVSAKEPVPNKSMVSASSGASRKEVREDVSSITEVPNDPDGSSTPPPENDRAALIKSSSAKGKEVSSSAHDDTGYVSMSCPLWFAMNPYYALFIVQ